MRTLTTITLLTLTLVFSGCAAKNPYGLVAVSGKVFVDGQPAAGITVTFSPENGDGISSAGLTDEQGGFVLSAAYGSGCVPGVYRITFSKREIPGSECFTSEEVVAKYGTAMPAPVYHIPQRYEDAQTNGVEPVTVQAGQKNYFEFQLNGK